MCVIVYVTTHTYIPKLSLPSSKGLWWCRWWWWWWWWHCDLRGICVKLYPFSIWFFRCLLPIYIRIFCWKVSSLNSVRVTFTILYYINYMIILSFISFFLSICSLQIIFIFTVSVWLFFVTVKLYLTIFKLCFWYALMCCYQYFKCFTTSYYNWTSIATSVKCDLYKNLRAWSHSCSLYKNYS